MTLTRDQLNWIYFLTGKINRDQLTPANAAKQAAKDKTWQERQEAWRKRQEAREEVPEEELL